MPLTSYVASSRLYPLVSPRLLSVLALVCLLAVAGCDSSPSADADPDPDPDPNPLTATLSSIQARVFTPSCAVSGCHVGSAPREGLNLSNGRSFSELVSVASIQKTDLLLVDPGNPDDSYLIHKLEGRPNITDTRMPRGRSALPQATINVIRQWIADGALQN